MGLFKCAEIRSCKPFGGPPTLSGPWTLHLGPLLDLKLRPWVYLQGILGGLEGYLSTLGHLDLSWVNLGAILRRLEGYVVHLGAILGHLRAILGHPGAMLGGLEGDLGAPGAHLWTS